MTDDSGYRVRSRTEYRQSDYRVRTMTDDSDYRVISMTEDRVILEKNQ